MTTASSGPRRAARHTLIVSIDPEEPEERIGQVVCHGVTESCRTWWQCSESHEWDKEAFGDGSAGLTDSIYEGNDVLHGVEHRVIEGMVMTPSEQCLAHTMDSAVDSIYEAAQGREPGEYPCDVVYEGDELVLISMARAVTATTENEEN